MTLLTFLVLLLIGLLGFLAGCCYEGCRRGGTLDLHTALAVTSRQRDRLLEQAVRRATTTGKGVRGARA
jgi:hypothetical protein